MAVSTPPQPTKSHKTTAPITVSEPTGPESGAGKWMALAAALLGWMFDGAEMGVFSLVGRPAVTDLMGKYLEAIDPSKREAEVAKWFAIITAGFLIGAATGGVLFGWLGDRIGRVRAMTLSVLTYALFTGCCGMAWEAWQVGGLRFIAALGMGGEWSLGVALVMEVWPNKSRAFMAGLIGAAANVGYLMVGLIGLVLLQVLGSLESILHSTGLSEDLVKTLVANKGWRLMMFLGTVPALLTFFIRMFVPESEKWKKEEGKGTTSNWATQDLLGVLIGVAGPALIVYVWAWEGPTWLPHGIIVRALATIVGLAVATVGYTFPVVRFFQRQAAGGDVAHWGPTFRRMLLGACLSAVALMGTWGSTQWAPTWADKVVDEEMKVLKVRLDQEGKSNLYAEALKNRPRAKEYMLVWLSVGAIVGTVLAALAGDWLGRRVTYCLMCVLSLGSVYWLFVGNHTYGPMMLFCCFFAGACTASFYGWLPLYLPELFRTNVRATGQGFSFNFGRIIAAVGALFGGSLPALFPKAVEVMGISIPPGYPLACSTISLVYLVGLGIIWLAPETRGKPLPE